MANSGCQEDAAAAEALFVDCFKGLETIVGPSGSCVHHIRCHLDAIEQTPETRKVRAGARELVEFLHDDLKVEAFPWAAFQHDGPALVEAVVNRTESVHAADD